MLRRLRRRPDRRTVRADPHAALHGRGREHRRRARPPAAGHRHGPFGPRRRHGPPGGVPPARNRHGQFGIRADRPLRTLRIRPLRHRRRLFPQAQPYADLRKRRGVPPHGAPAHGVHVTMSVSWNPWHGCRKISEGCRNCYVYRQDSRHDKDSREVRQTAMFDRPVRRSRDGRFKVPAGEMVYTCFTSDFLLEEADAWRAEAWEMMRIRHDLRFLFFTKRIDRLAAVLPPDWGDGYENVVIGCTVENQAMADYRLLLFLATPVRHRLIVCAPLLGPLDIARYLSPAVEEVSAGGESGNEARPCDYAWVLGLREQCVAADISFCFHQTGARFVKDGRMYRIHRRYQHSQARKAGIDYRLKR